MTRPPNNPSSQNYRQVLRGYLRLHQLTVEGRDESPDADAVRDSLDLPWRALTDTERGGIQGLSADLYDISELIAGGPREMNPQAQKNLAEAFEAKHRGEWERALELLRRWSKYIAPALLSYLRGGIWLVAGFPEVGAVFFEHAASLEPDNANYAAIFLLCLAQSDSRRAREMAEHILRTPKKHSPSLVIMAGDVEFYATREMAELDAAAVFRSLIPVLTQALPEIPQDEKRSVYLMGLVLLAFCHEHLGEVDAAHGYYTRGLRLEPSHDAMLTGRGILTYGKSPQSTSDLEQAVKLGSSLVWPYFFLAHHYLLNNRYEECRRLCDRALQMNASQTIQSQLSEWLAIAEAELGFSPERVLATFEQALRLDPSNDMARQNLDRYEQSIPRPVAQTMWEKRSANTVRVFGQAERRVLLAV